MKKSKVQSLKSKIQSRESKVEEGSKVPILNHSFVTAHQHAANGNGTRWNASLPNPTLGNEFGFWELAFRGQQAVLRCELGAAYVGWLLANRPAEPIHALELAAKVSGQACPCFGKEIFHPDRAGATWFWLHKQKELEAIVDSEDELDPVKEEALRELEAIYAYERSHCEQTRQTELAAESVARAIYQFHRRLAVAMDLR